MFYVYVINEVEGEAVEGFEKGNIVIENEYKGDVLKIEFKRRTGDSIRITGGFRAKLLCEITEEQHEDFEFLVRLMEEFEKEKTYCQTHGFVNYVDSGEEFGYICSLCWEKMMKTLTIHTLCSKCQKSEKVSLEKARELAEAGCDECGGKVLFIHFNISKNVTSAKVFAGVGDWESFKGRES